MKFLQSVALSSLVALGLLVVTGGCGSDLVFPGMDVVTPTGTPGTATPTCTTTGGLCTLSSDCCSGVCTTADGVTFTCA